MGGQCTGVIVIIGVIVCHNTDWGIPLSHNLENQETNLKTNKIEIFAIRNRNKNIVKNDAQYRITAAMWPQVFLYCYVRTANFSVVVAHTVNLKICGFFFYKTNAVENDIDKDTYHVRIVLSKY